jgi:hypothetical protein
MSVPGTLAQTCRGETAGLRSSKIAANEYVINLSLIRKLVASLKTLASGQ